MLIQLTTAGRALFDLLPTSFVINRVDFGAGFGYTLPSEPTGLTGAVVQQVNTTLYPVVLDTNTVKYQLYLAQDLPTFTFGEAAFYSNGTLVGVSVSPVSILKQGPSAGVDGKDVKLDVFLDLQPGNRYALSVVDPSGSANSFPRVSIPDLLVPPAKNGNNAYVVYGLGLNDIPYFAFSDPTGKWSFSSKTRVAYSGVVGSCGPLGLSATVLSGSYSGATTDCVLQFTSGELRGYCRQLTAMSDPTLQWSTPLGVLPVAGDTFIIVSPPEVTSSGGGGGGGTITLPFEQTGDLLSSVGTTPVRLPIGAAGTVLKSVAGVPSWQPETTVTVDNSFPICIAAGREDQVPTTGVPVVWHCPMDLEVLDGFIGLNIAPTDFILSANLNVEDPYTSVVATSVFTYALEVGATPTFGPLTAPTRSYPYLRRGMRLHFVVDYSGTVAQGLKMYLRCRPHVFTAPVDGGGGYGPPVDGGAVG